ncbi:MAG: Quinoprotein glucose dehydrogenase, partial [Rhizorhabdus sp.]|nr:Quinoprotein glucose dehydrogenase [Rhizorhabdus sp.]
MTLPKFEGLGARRASLALILSLAASPCIAAPGAKGEWPALGGTELFQRYSPLDQIAPTNLPSLGVAWERPSIAEALSAKFPDLSPSAYNRGTPIMVNGLLYVPDAVGLVEAIDPETGASKWIQQPLPATMKEA